MLALALALAGCGSDGSSRDGGGGEAVGGSPGSGGSSGSGGSVGGSGEPSPGGGPGSGGALAGTGGAATDPTRPWSAPSFDPAALPTAVPTVEILVPDAALTQLEAAPFYGEDVAGTFIDGEGRRFESVDVSYRGAYALLSLIQYDPLGRRNWKLKFPSEDRYRERREWNLNFEPHLRQLLAYDLLRFAGIRVPSARHVVLKVNGEPQGLYLEYEDPDSKDWLWDMFGDDSGDLYKAALDMPASEGQPEQKYFAETTYLGADDESYRYHYNKKTNHKDPAIADDFSVLRGFLQELNELPDAELGPWLEARFDVDAFLSYLVVSNFISNWDSFPQRPKNFWLFEIRNQSRLAFIPWDLDGTFQTRVDRYNQMGPEAPLFFNLRGADYSALHSEEGDQRPLAWRLLALPSFEAAYLARYRELTASILSASYLEARVDALAALVEPHLTDQITGEDRFGEVFTERSDFAAALEDLRGFVAARTASVTAQLAAAP